jgi:putative aldouronate transport system substrate-binding protein
MNAFITTPLGNSSANLNPTLVLKDGKADIQANKKEWREGLRYIKSLYDEGLIDKGAFTQNGEALLRIGDNAGAPILGSATVLHLGQAVSLDQEDGRDKNYDAVPPLAGPNGLAYAAYNFPSAPGATFVLTNKATKTDQVAAIKLLDYIFTTEGHLEAHIGKKGVEWTDPGPKDQALDPNLKPLYKLTDSDEETGWGAVAQYNNVKEFRNAQAVPEDIYDSAGYERRLFEATNLYAGKEDQAAIFPYWGVWVDPADASEMATLQTNLENYVAQNSLQFITGSKNLDTEWDAYVQGFQGLGLPRYLELLQAAYDKSSVKR